MQFQADMMGGSILRPIIRETTALGAAYLAGLAAGFWKGLDEVRALWKCDAVFKAAIDEARREELIAGWRKAVGRSLRWAE
jgi:glycerol kinase